MFTAVDSGYSGPRFDGEISADFMNDLLAWIKEQKVLHRKYAYKVREQCYQSNIQIP